MATNLVEAELFGHERGSFTGANRTHRGCFERASGGTLFLDEITEMPIEMQVRLLRVLETGRICRVGGEHEIAVDARIIAATNRQPEAAIREGKLREDLWFRLAAFPLGIPPLRDRGEDVVALAEHFLQAQNESEHTDKRFSPTALSRLGRHTWPGNVRELKNTVYRAYIMADEEVHIDDDNLTATRTVANGCDGPLTFVVGTRLEDVEKRIILATLNHYRGSKKRAAQVLGVSLKTLYNRLNEYQSSVDEHVAGAPRTLNMQ
jgi:DNA-binding NtrC family response regulator